MLRGDARPQPHRALAAELVLTPGLLTLGLVFPGGRRPPDSAGKKKNPRVNKFWKQRVVCPTLRERHIAVAFQGSDKSCSEERRFALFHPMLPKLD